MWGFNIIVPSVYCGKYWKYFFPCKIYQLYFAKKKINAEKLKRTTVKKIVTGILKAHCVKLRVYRRIFLSIRAIQEIRRKEEKIKSVMASEGLTLKYWSISKIKLSIKVELRNNWRDIQFMGIFCGKRNFWAFLTVRVKKFKKFNFLWNLRVSSAF